MFPQYYSQMHGQAQITCPWVSREWLELLQGPYKCRHLVLNSEQSPANWSSVWICTETYCMFLLASTWWYIHPEISCHMGITWKSKRTGRKRLCLLLPGESAISWQQEYQPISLSSYLCYRPLQMNRPWLLRQGKGHTIFFKVVPAFQSALVTR